MANACLGRGRSPDPGRARRIGRYVLPLVVLAAPAAHAQFSESTGTQTPAAAPAVSAATVGTTQTDNAGAGIAGASGSPFVIREAPVRLGPFFGLPFSDGIGPVTTDEPTRAYEFFPSIGARVLATDNISPGFGRRQAEVITSLDPTLLVTASSLRVQGAASYTPTFSTYLAGTEPARLDHRFNGNALVSVIPGSLFLDLRGSAQVLPVSGGFADVETSALPRRDRAQTASFSATPYYITRFGSFANAIVGYTYQYSRVGGGVSGLDPITRTPFFAPQDFSAHTGFGAVRTGEYFGRAALEARASATAYDGTGVLDGAHRSVGVVEGRYAFVRGITGIGEVGYEDQEYGGTNPIRISGPVWGFGARLEPGPNSVITIRYRRRDGFNAPSAEARVGLGDRTVLTALYSDRLNTLAQRQADLLDTTAVDEAGRAYDVRTGGPSLGIASESLLAVQSGLFRNRLLRATIVHALLRDTFALDITRDERIPVSAVPGTVNFRQVSTSIGLSWNRALSELTSFDASVRYGRLNNDLPALLGATRDFDTYSLRLGLAHRFGQNLAGSIQYLITNSSVSGLGAANSVQNVVIASLRRSF